MALLSSTTPSTTRSTVPGRSLATSRILLVAAALVAAAVVSVMPSNPVEATPTLDLVSIDPARLLETRIGPDEQTVDGDFEGVGRAAADSVNEVVIAGRGGVTDSA